jgi:Fe-S-cluster formation regulator IscX/YfhJ
MMKNAPFLDTKTFARLAPVVQKELRLLARAGAFSAAAALKHVFVQLYGIERSREEQRRFMFFAAPLARRIAVELANAEERIGPSDLRVSDLKEWLWWLDTFDPLCARMVDLRYFAGLTTRETAQTLRMSPEGVVHELRFAKAWLQARLS